VDDLAWMTGKCLAVGEPTNAIPVMKQFLAVGIVAHELLVPLFEFGRTRKHCTPGMYHMGGGAISMIRDFAFRGA
jgi:hypothetical protein